MLALTRREGERVLIGDPADPAVTLRVVTARGDRIGLELVHHAARPAGGEAAGPETTFLELGYEEAADLRGLGRVQVTSLHGRRVTLTFDVPRSVPVVRAELT